MDPIDRIDVAKTQKSLSNYLSVPLIDPCLCFLSFLPLAFAVYFDFRIAGLGMQPPDVRRNKEDRSDSSSVSVV